MKTATVRTSTGRYEVYENGKKVREFNTLEEMETYDEEHGIDPS